MKVGIFGGAFDPPTLGHKNIYDKLKDHLDEVWAMPCYKSMFGKNMSSDQDRLNMCKLIFENTSDFEIKNQLTNGTIYCIQKLQEEYDHDFVLIIGKDNADVFHKWHKAEELKALLPIYVINRPGYEAKSDWYKKEPHKYFEDICFDVSSTEVRNKIKNNEDVSNLILPNVEKYIKENITY